MASSTQRSRSKSKSHVDYDDDFGFESLSDGSADKPIDVQVKVRSKKEVRQKKRNVTYKIKDSNHIFKGQTSQVVTLMNQQKLLSNVMLSSTPYG